MWYLFQTKTSWLICSPLKKVPEYCSARQLSNLRGFFNLSKFLKNSIKIQQNALAYLTGTCLGPCAVSKQILARGFCNQQEQGGIYRGFFSTTDAGFALYPHYGQKFQMLSKKKFNHLVSLSWPFLFHLPILSFRNKSLLKNFKHHFKFCFFNKEELITKLNVEIELKLYRGSLPYVTFGSF